MVYLWDLTPPTENGRDGLPEPSTRHRLEEKHPIQMEGDGVGASRVASVCLYSAAYVRNMAQHGATTSQEVLVERTPSHERD